MSTSSETVLAAVLQLQCTSDKKRNFAAASDLIRRSRSYGAKVAFLPEAFDFVGGSSEETRKLSETIEGPTISEYKKLAQELGIALSLGGTGNQCNCRDGFISEAKIFFRL